MPDTLTPPAPSEAPHPASQGDVAAALSRRDRLRRQLATLNREAGGGKGALVSERDGDAQDL